MTMVEGPADLLVRLAAATVLGAAVGLERERTEHAAGLRTHALVSLGASLFMVVSAYGFGSVLGTHVVLDPSRVAAQVASGIGFLGAGTIILRREIVRGLTTAASIWAVAAVGIACGGGMYVSAVAATVLILIVLSAMRPLENLLFPTHRRIRIALTCEGHCFREEDVRRVIGEAGAQLQRIELRFDNKKQQDQIEVVLRFVPEKVTALVATLRDIDGVREVRTSFEGPLR